MPHYSSSRNKRSPSSEESTNIHGNSRDKNMESNVGSKASAKIASEPCTSAKENQVGPLSGSRFFTCIMLKTHVQSPYQLAIPSSFYSFLPAANVPVILSRPSLSKSWELSYLGDRPIRRFDGGWKRFAVENKLRIGDGCVFELMDDKNLRFEVRILSGQVPDLFALCGRSNEVPIEIDV